MIGYKCTDQNGCCKGFKFEVGKTYKKNTPKNELECCTDVTGGFLKTLGYKEAFRLAWDKASKSEHKKTAYSA